MSKQQKVCGAVLLLAGAAFVVDRVFIGAGGPAEAEASLPSLPPTLSSSTAKPAGSPAGRPNVAAKSDYNSGSSRSLAARLQDAVQAEALDLNDVPDAFRPSRKWEPPVEVAAAGAGAPALPVAPPKPVFDPAANFRTSHKLTAVLRNGTERGHSVAVIESARGGKPVVRPVRRGEQVDGFTLVDVREHAAILWSGDVQVILVLQGFQLAGETTASAAGN